MDFGRFNIGSYGVDSEPFFTFNDDTKCTLKIGGKELKNELVKLYYNRKMDLYIKEKKDGIEAEYNEIPAVKEYNDLIAEFNTSLFEIANRYNREDAKYLIKNEDFEEEYSYELNRDYYYEVEEKYVKEYREKVKKLEELIDEVNAKLSISNDKDYQLEVLKEYEIINKKGKLNV